MSQSRSIKSPTQLWVKPKALSNWLRQFGWAFIGLVFGAIAVQAAAPTIAAIPDQTVVIDRPTDAYHLTVADAETPELSLVLRGLSSNTNLVPTNNIFFGVAFNTWYLTVTPKLGQTGTSTISIIVRDQSGLEATNSFLFTATGVPSGYSRFVQTNAIQIPGVANVAGSASPYPSTNTVTGMSGWITNMTMTFSGFTHDRIQDVNMLLVSPSGAGVVLFSEISGQNRKCTNVTVTFDDDLFYALPQDYDLWSEPLRPANFQSTNFYPGATWTNSPVALSSFYGASPNGNWMLYVYDDTAGNNGVISNGWSLLIATATGPFIGDFTNRTILTNTSTGPIGFYLNDPDTQLSNIVLFASSSNTNLVTTNNIVFGGSGTNRTVSVTPNANQAGVSTITIFATDGAVTNSRGFLLTVSSGNLPPTIAAIPDKTVLIGRAAGPFNLTISDPETPTGSLILSASSSNTNLVPNANLIPFNSGVQTLVVQPVDGQVGSSVITVSVSDGLNVTSTNFNFTVIAAPPGTGIFNATSVLSFPLTNVASVYPSTNVVSGMVGNITSVTLTLKGLTHTAPNNLEMLLVSPGGQKSALFSHVSGGPTTNVTVTLDETATYQLPPSPYTLLTGTYKSANFGNGTFPSPAPAGPYSTNLLPFAGVSPNGNWLLYIVNDPAGTGSGVLSNGWSLAITTDSSNAAPTISAISDQVTTIDTPTAAIPFTISDLETAPSSLVLTALSSNPTLIPTNNIAFGGSGSNRTVTLAPASGQFGAATLRLLVSDGTTTTSNSFQLFVSQLAAGTGAFSNTAAITVPLIGTANPYPSTNTVSGLGGTITNLSVRIRGLSHTWTRDVDMLLVSPWGQALRLMENAGSGAVSGVSFNLTNSGASLMPTNTSLTSVTYLPSAFPTNAIYPAPAPTGPYLTNLAGFNGVSANGNWLLYVKDHGANDSGIVSNGWVLNIQTAITGPQTPTLTDLLDQSIPVSANTGPMPFTINDLDTAISNLTVTGFSSNTNLVPNSAVVFSGSGSNRTVTVTPTPALAGNSTITVVVSDGTLSATNTFLLTVSSPATQLRLETSADGSGTVISNQTLLIGTPLTAYTITRDAYGNFVSNVVASSWALANTVGGVVASNLVVAGDSRSATFTGTAPGTGKVRATSGSFAAVSTGYLNVYNSGNFPPVISPIANRTTLVGRAVGPFDITVSDAETATGSLIITASSSNTNLVPNSNFVIFNSGVTTFTVQPADGQTGVTTITVTVSDGVNTSSTDFDLTVLPSGTGVGVFDKPALITLPQTNVASAYPLTNVVSGLLGNITKVSVTFKGLTHSFPHDLEMLLVGPGGQKSVFMSQAGGGSANNYTVTIDDTTQYALPPYPYTILTGTYKSADFGHGTFPSPAPAGPYAADMSTFIGSAPNGTWSLYILNGAGTTGSGVISNGWSLAVYTDVTNSAPTITAISNRVTTVNTATAAIPFTITDAETAASNLVLTASSSNTNLVSANGIVFGGSGTNRTVTVTPSSNQLGSATLTLTVSDGQLSASTNFQLTVNPAPLTITASNFSRGYGLTNPVLTGSIVGLQAGDNITANFTTTATTNSPLGTYPITFTLNDPGNKLGNYTITTNNGTLTVTNALLTVTASNSNKVYGTSRTFAGTEFALTSGTLFNGNTITNVTLSSAGATNTAPIGAYPIAATNATGSGLSNYKITYVTGALTVTTAPLTVTANSTNKVYGVTRTFAGTEFTVTSGALVNGDTLTSATLASAGALSNAPAGAYAITVTNAIGLGASNYAISYVAGTLTVNSASLLITAGSTNKTYGATLNPSAYTVAGLLNGDSVTNLTLASAGSVSNAAVGAYSIVPNAALGVGLTNYTIGYSNGTLTVNAANLLITAGNTNKIYGSTLVPLAYSVSGLLNNDSVTNILQTTSGSVSNAPVGSYSIVPGSAQGHGLTNYTIGYSNGTLTVSPANLLITAGSTNKIYGSTLVPLAYTVAGLVNSDSVTNVSLNSAGAINTAPVGTYPITASGAQGLGLTNYSIGYSNGALTVSGAALLISAGNTNKTYGSTLAPVTYTVIGLLNADSVTNLALTSLGSVSNAPVGSYSITPSLAQGSGLTNYAIGYSNGTFTVNAASLSITAGNTNKPYGSTLNPTAYAVAGLLNGDAVTNVTLNSSGSVSNAPVGSYPIVASAAVGFGLTNYVIGYTDGTLTVNSASLLITAASTNKVYGATLSPTEYAVAGLLNGDSVTNVALTSAGSASSAPAGSYTILASAAAGVGLTNYAIAYASGTMTVNPASLLVNIASTNKIYGATLNPVDYSIAGLLNSDSVTNVVLTSTGSAATAPAGAHVITASVIEGVGLTNYSVILSNGVLTVNPASLLITAQGTNKTYGVTLVPSTYNVNGLLNSDSVTNVTLASAGASADAPVGSYLITPSTASGLGLTNYAIGYSNGTLSVNAAGLLITTVSTNKNYGVTLNPTAYTVSGLLNGDSVTNVVLASGGSVSNAPVGSYGITAALVEGSGLTNYAIGYSNGVLSVGYAALSITALDTNKVYGTSVTPSGFSVAGLVAGDSVTNVTLTSSGSTSNAPVGVHPIVPSLAAGTGLTNYSISYVAGVFTVNPASLLITAGSTNKPYGATLDPVSYSVSGLLNGDSVTNVTLTSAGSPSNAPAGSYAIVPAAAQGAGLTNYTIGYSNGVMTVGGVTLVISPVNTDKFYGVAQSPTAYTVSGLLPGDSVTNVTLTSVGAAATAPVGGYFINASAAQGIGLASYNITYNVGVMTVNPVHLTITTLGTNKIYGAELNPQGYTVSGLLNADTVTNAVLVSAGAASNAPVGLYPITVGSIAGAGLTNYMIDYNYGTQSVTSANLLISAGSTNKTYGTTLSPAGFVVSGLLNADSVTNLTLLSAGSVSNAPTGSYPITASAAQGSGLTNYNIGYSNGTLTVSAANLLVTTLGTNKVYGTTLNPTGYVVGGLLNGDSVTNVTLSSDGSVSNASVGNYPITASIAGVGLTNYTIGYSNGTLAVGAAGLLITALDTNKVYGTTLNPAGYSVSGLLNADSVTNVVLQSSGALSNAPVGAHVITPSTASGLGLTNYAISYSNGTLTVNAANLLVTTFSTNKTYGTTLNPTSYSIVGLLNSDSVTNVTLTSAGSAATAPVGSHPINASIAGVGLTNYAIGYSNGTLSVSAAGLLITTVSTNKNYGVSLNPTAYTVSGLLNGDSVSNVVLASAGSVSNAPVGSYGITAALVEGSGLTNYAIGYSNGVLSVGYAALSITAANTNKVYGQTITFTGTEFTTSGLLAGDAVTNVSVTCAGGGSNAPVGTYPIVIGGAQGTGITNYAITYNFGTLSVAQANSTVTSLDTNKVYGTELNPSEYTVSGLLNGDSVTNVSLSCAGSASNAPTGLYLINVGVVEGLGISNYSVLKAFGAMTVSPATLTITADSTNKVYGTSLTPVSYSVAGLVGGDSVTNVSLATSGGTSNAPVGSYTINASSAQGSGLTNYAITYVAGSLGVTPAPLSITANNASKLAGTTLTFAGTEFTSSGLKNADAVTSVSLSSSGAGAGAAPGTYPIVATIALGIGLTNYAISYVNGTLTVTNAGALFQITSIVVSNDVATITWNSQSNQTYRLQFKDDFAATNWIDAAATVTAVGASTVTTNALLGAPQRYFRVKVENIASAPAPQIISITANASQAVVTCTSVAGHFYRLQYNDDLTTTNWADVLPEVGATGASSSATNSTAGVTKRFYRVWLRQ